ncbi:MAG: TOMM precursor leader peptide-binding protein [Mycobacteriales bacterium]
MAYERPRLKEHLTAEVVSDSRVFVVGEDRAVMVPGGAAVAVLPYLDGQHTVGDIAARLAEGLAAAEVFLAIRRYEALGLLADGRPGLPDPALAYWDAMDVDPAPVAALAGRPAPTLVGIGDVDVEPFAGALRDLGLAPAVVEAAAPGPAAAPDGLVVAVVDDYLAPLLTELNRALLATGTPWLLAKPAGLRIWLGPLLRPGRTGCWECLRQRVEGNRQVESYLAGKRRDRSPLRTSKGALAASWAAAAALLAPEIAQILATGTSPRLDGVLVTVDRRTLASAEHVLVRQPQCPACGDPGLLARRDPRIVLTPRDVRWSADGGYRVEPPEATLDRLSRHISPVLGAVSALTSVTESQAGVTHTYTAGHNFAVIGDNMDLLRRNLRGQSGGKGRTDVQARVSAVAEAIERYSGVWRGTEPVRRAAYDDLGPDVAVLIADLLLYSQRQYADRVEWNARRAGRLQLVPEPFRTDLPCDWTTAWSLTHDRPTLVPAAYVWFGHPDLADHFFTFGDGNGNAAGNVQEEAILQGLCELIERDAVGIWWYNRIRRPAFDLDSLDDPYVELLRRYYAGMGRDLWMLDITSDLGVPTFAAVSPRQDGPTEDVGLGFGAHIDPRVAAMRALTEMNQFLPAVARRNPDGSTLYWEDDPAALAWWQTTRIAEEPWLVPDGSPPTGVGDHGGLVRDTLTDDLLGLLDRVHAAGLEVLVADQTRPDLDLAVVKVMVPGLRHFWRRLAPGRLYDVPVQLGWLPRPLPEEQLNPKSVFF